MGFFKALEDDIFNKEINMTASIEKVMGNFGANEYSNIKVVFEDKVYYLNVPYWQYGLEGSEKEVKTIEMLQRIVDLINEKGRLEKLITYNTGEKN